MEKTRENRTTVIFVRHAQSLHPWSDDRTRPLTPEGLRDRQIVLETLRDRRIGAFLSSPYKRSVDTVRPAAEFFGMKIRTDERFRERKSGFDARGTLEKRWRDFSYAEEGGESLGAVQERNLAALSDALRTYRGKTVVIGTHGTALSTVLAFYRPDFGLDGFLRIVEWMPYIVEMTFDGEEPAGIRELAHVEKAYQPVDFSVISACGENCADCEKKRAGACPGCIGADGAVPGWADADRCGIRACAGEHGVGVCALCREFPCARLTELVPRRADAVAHLSYLREEALRQGEAGRGEKPGGKADPTPFV